MRSSLRWLLHASFLLGIALVPIAVADTVTVRNGSLHIFSTQGNFRGWFDKGSNVGNAFKVIYEDAGSLSPHWENQGSFYYTDAGPGNSVNIYCLGCGIHQGTGEVVDLQLGTAIGQHSQTNVWLPLAISERSQVLEIELRRRDPSRSFLWTVDSTSGANSDWPVKPILLDASGASVNENLVIDADVDDCANHIAASVNCNVWWGPITDPNSATHHENTMTLTFRQTSAETVWLPPADSSSALCT